MVIDLSAFSLFYVPSNIGLVACISPSGSSEFRAHTHHILGVSFILMHCV